MHFLFFLGQQIQTSSQWRYTYNKGKQFENQIFIHGPNCKINIYFGLFGGGGGALKGL